MFKFTSSKPKSFLTLVQEGELARCQKGLDDGTFNIKERDSHGWNALHWAVFNVNLEMCEYLLKVPGIGTNERTLEDREIKLHIKQTEICKLSSAGNEQVRKQMREQVREQTKRPILKGWTPFVLLCNIVDRFYIFETFNQDFHNKLIKLLFMFIELGDVDNDALKYDQYNHRTHFYRFLEDLYADIMKNQKTHLFETMYKLITAYTKHAHADINQRILRLPQPRYYAGKQIHLPKDPNKLVTFTEAIFRLVQRTCGKLERNEENLWILPEVISSLIQAGTNFRRCVSSAQPTINLFYFNCYDTPTIMSTLLLSMFAPGPGSFYDDHHLLDDFSRVKQKFLAFYFLLSAGSLVNRRCGRRAARNLVCQFYNVSEHLTEEDIRLLQLCCRGLNYTPTLKDRYWPACVGRETCPAHLTTIRSNLWNSDTSSLEEEIFHPSVSLLHASAAVVRACLKPNAWVGADQLSIPTKLKNFITLEHEEVLSTFKFELAE